MSKTKNTKLTCTCCGKEKHNREFYSSNSHFHRHTGKLHTCKNCIWEYVGEVTEENLDVKLGKIKETLRMIDRPFKSALFFETTIPEAIRDSSDIFGTYMKNIAMPQHKKSTWDDSDFEDFKKSSQMSTQSIYEEAEKEIETLEKDELVELIKFFGRGFTDEDYIWLSREYTDFTNRYECDSKGMELLIREICLTQLDIQKRRMNGEKVDQQLKTLQDLLGSSNLKPVQETGANAVEQESFGTLIKKFERDRPIPEPDPMWKDVDRIGKYIRTFFLGHMSKAIGVENKYQDEYEEELSKHTVKPEDIDGDENE